MRCVSRRLWIGDDGAGIAVKYIREFMLIFFEGVFATAR